MPADSTTLADEGVVIEPRVLDEAAIDELAAQMRRPEQRRADLRAQLAACRIGALRTSQLRDRFGPEVLREAFAATLDYAERRTRACLRELDDGVYEAHDVLEAREGDLPIALKATVDGDTLTLDFSGSAGQHEGNLNCPLAVTRSACYFAVRVLTDPDIPANAGAYRPVTVIAPGGSLLNARSPAAVVGGNVETSSRVADVVLRAFGHALGQGTMNNLTLGDDEVVYYETIGGGQGACADADGPSAVHVAMSNTLNTPVEALELEFPLRVVEYSIRARVRRCGTLQRRRRGDPRAGGAGAAALLADHGAPPPRPAGRRRWRSGAAGTQSARRPRAARQGERRAGARPAPADRDAGRRRLRKTAIIWPMNERVAFLGLGIMGSRMAANLARAGYRADGLEPDRRDRRAICGRARRDARGDARRRRRAKRRS